MIELIDYYNKKSLHCIDEIKTVNEYTDDRYPSIKSIVKFKDGSTLESIESYKKIKSKIVGGSDDNSVSLEISKYGKLKLEYILGNYDVEKFPNVKPTLQWTGAVIDFLSDIKIVK